MPGFIRMPEITGVPIKQFPFYLLLLPLFFIFHGYVEHYPVVSAKTALLVLLKYIGFTGLILVLSYIFIRSWRSSFLFCFLLLAFHIFFGPVHDVLKLISAGTFLSSYSFLVPLFAIIFLVMFILFRKKKPVPRTLAVYLNLLFIAFIIIDVFQLYAKINSQEKSAAATIKLKPCKNCNKPDVFLIIADGYAGRIPLKEIFRFDNSRFENEMKSRGFFIVDSSLSNYNYTPFTMASMLSMNYLQNLEGKNKSRSDRDICFRHINSNPVIDFFTGHGYTIINHSIFQLNNKLPQIRTRFINVGGDLLTDQTFFSRIDRDLRFNLVTRFKIRSEIERMAYFHLKLNNYLYSQSLQTVTSDTTSPKFVYTHLEMPHYPYYFDSQGKPNPFEKITEENYYNLEYYIEYLQYCNKQYLQLIDHIQQNAKTPPVIIFMSDHSFRDFERDSVNRKYHFMNMNMVNLPSGNYNGFYKGISSVNQFRVIMNAEFGQKLPMIKDSTSFLSE